MLEKYHYIKFYKYCKKILDDGVVTDKEIDDLEIHEAKGKTIAFTFGRFNPPTIGHEMLLESAGNTARRFQAELYVFDFHTHIILLEIFLPYFLQILTTCHGQ
jgi:hypothetical protein